MIVLDTNVLSEFMRAEPATQVLAWVDGQPAMDLTISAITVAEILHGIARLPAGKRKQGLEAHALAMFEEDFATICESRSSCSAKIAAAPVSSNSAADGPEPSPERPAIGKTRS